MEAALGNSGCHRLSPGHRQCDLSQGRTAEGKLPAGTGSIKAWDETQTNPKEPEQPLIVPRAVQEQEAWLSGPAVAQGRLGEQLAYLAFPVLAE